MAMSVSPLEWNRGKVEALWFVYVRVEDVLSKSCWGLVSDKSRLVGRIGVRDYYRAGRNS